MTHDIQANFCYDDFQTSGIACYCLQLLKYSILPLTNTQNSVPTSVFLFLTRKNLTNPHSLPSNYPLHSQPPLLLPLFLFCSALLSCLLSQLCRLLEQPMTITSGMSLSLHDNRRNPSVSPSILLSQTPIKTSREGRCPQ